MAALFYLFALVLIVATRFLGKRWNAGHFTGGLVFGIYNEICFEFCWNYSATLGPMVWRDVPLIIILGWSIYTALALALSERVMSWTGGNGRWIRKALDVTFFFIIGYTLEALMSRLGYWHYNMEILGIGWMQMFGYFFVGLLVSCTGRSFQAIIDQALAR
jgi:uncharacterized membrane protein